MSVVRGWEGRTGGRQRESLLAHQIGAPVIWAARRAQVAARPGQKGSAACPSPFNSFPW